MSPAAAQSAPQEEAPAAAITEDEETARRRARAERFGIPFVAPKKTSTQTKAAKPTAPKAAAAAKTAVNGAGGRKAAAKPVVNVVRLRFHVDLLLRIHANYSFLL